MWALSYVAICLPVWGIQTLLINVLLKGHPLLYPPWAPNPKSLLFSKHCFSDFQCCQIPFSMIFSKSSLSKCPVSSLSPTMHPEYQGAWNKHHLSLAEGKVSIGAGYTSKTQMGFKTLRFLHIMAKPGGHVWSYYNLSDSSPQESSINSASLFHTFALQS